MDIRELKVGAPVATAMLALNAVALNVSLGLAP